MAKPGSDIETRLGGLDGLRGLAMLMVIFCHLRLFTLGWTGLSSFFVLSGFLITRILLSDRERASTLGQFFKRFYIRRLLRVFPIYYAYLAVLTLLVWIAPPLFDLRDDVAPAFLYVYNLYMCLPGHEHTRMLDHLWSLSVEEQFYLVWPWLVAFAPRRVIGMVCAVLFVLGPLLRQLAIQFVLPRVGVDMSVAPGYVYVLTTSQIDAFALGALINFIDLRRLRINGWHLLVAIVALLALGFAVNGRFGMATLSLGWPLFMPLGHQYIWGYTLVNLLWFGVICAILAGGATQRFFSIPLLDYLGKRSYSTYIIHFPLLAFMWPLLATLQNRFGAMPGTLLFCVPYLSAVFSISAGTFRFIEMPMTQLKERFSASRRPAPDPKKIAQA
jgi:peptidoglycan/LPS O-acetylase OafA/YrhL